MKQLGMRLLIQRDESDRGAFRLVIPDWIGERLGELLLMSYDGDRLIIGPAERDH